MAERPTVWELIDFDVIYVDFVYEEVPCSDQRALATELCRRIPRGWWTSYSALARAYNWVVERESLGYNQQYARTIGQLVDDSRAIDAGRQHEWSVPWHRMRDLPGLETPGGLCRSPREPDKQVHTNGTPDDLGHPNTRWKNEGGRLTKVGGQAVFTQQFDIDTAIKRRRIELAFV